MFNLFKLARHTKDRTFSLTADLETTEAIPFNDVASGMVFIPAGKLVTLITWHASNEKCGVFLPVHDADGAAVTQTVSGGNAYTLPDALFGAGALKAVVDIAATVRIVTKG